MFACKIKLKGFTLIEVLVVVVLVSIIGSYLLIHITNSSYQRQAKQIINQIRYQSNGLSDQAAILGMPLGLMIKNNQFVVLKPTQEGWLAQQASFKEKIKLDEPWHVMFETEQPVTLLKDKINNENELSPNIVFHEDGTNTGGRLELYYDDFSIPLTIHYQINGKITFQGLIDE